MKKIIAAVLAAFLFSAGLVASTSTSATAAPNCNYPNTCFPTETSAVKIKTKKAFKARIYVDVSSFGNGKPRGKLVFTFVKKKTGEVVKFRRQYPKGGGGQNDRYNFRPLAPGKYSVIVQYKPRDDQPYFGSADTIEKLKVKRGNRRR